MHTTLTPEESQVLIDGPSGKLELALARHREGHLDAWGIVCHPHPLHGGTMTNKVVTTLVKAFQAFGLNTIRFNFRGVGNSEGEFDDGKGELEDLLAVIDWVEKENGKQAVWLAGFSFGAYVAMQAAGKIKLERLVTVSPPVERFPVAELPPITCPWVLVQGERDDVVSPDAVFTFAENCHPRPRILRFPDAGHFFHGKLTELRTRIEEALV